MGDEIASTRFQGDDWSTFHRRLIDETRRLHALFDAKACSSRPPVGGFEIEAWLTDTQMRPAPRNSDFLKRLGSDLATTELAQFNIELNNTPRSLQGDAFKQFAKEMHATCRKVNTVASTMGLRAMTMGILPTIRPGDLSEANMSQMRRYRALNQQVLKARDFRPLHLHITADAGDLLLEYDSVMLEAAATSFQVHTQVPYAEAHHYYNASIIASAATVAVCANSPYLFDRQLWHETRIPLFEQSVDTGEGERRVSFGTDFARESIMECFDENVELFDTLLPILYDDKQTLSHLRLHNGTIWRWNRPLIGFDADGTVHFRVEHRVMSAGPSLVDMLANAAFYYGVAMVLKSECAQGRLASDFTTAKNDFYEAARYGLGAVVSWEGEKVRIDELVLEHLLPMAKDGLGRLGLDGMEHYLDIIRERVSSGQNGAAWQLAYVKRYGEDMKQLSDAYWRHQQEGRPVHEWEIR